jgi:hypothetical protein
MRVTSTTSAAQNCAEPDPESTGNNPDGSQPRPAPVADPPAQDEPDLAEQAESAEPRDATPAGGSGEAVDVEAGGDIGVPEEVAERATWSTRLAEIIRRPAVRDLAVCLGLIVLAGWLTHGLWPDPARRALADNIPDQALDEWFLAHGTRIYSGDFHLVTHLLNAPDGVNLLSNA